jgi:hypothetical protein
VGQRLYALIKSVSIELLPSDGNNNGHER